MLKSADEQCLETPHRPAFAQPATLTEVNTGSSLSKFNHEKM